MDMDSYNPCAPVILYQRGDSNLLFWNAKIPLWDIFALWSISREKLLLYHELTFKGDMFLLTGGKKRENTFIKLLYMIANSKTPT